MENLNSMQTKKAVAALCFRFPIKKTNILSTQFTYLHSQKLYSNISGVKIL